MRRMIPQKLIDGLKHLIAKLWPFSNKVDYVGEQVKINADVAVESLTSKGIANTGAIANIGDVAVSGAISATGEISAQKVSEAGDTDLIDLSSYISEDIAKSNTLYAKALVKHGMLHVVLSGNFVAKDLTPADNRILLNNFISAIPESVRTKIVREDGTIITATPTSGAFRVCTSVGSRFYPGTQGVQLYVLSSNQANNLTLQARPLPSIAEDTNVYIDARFALTI